MKKKLSILIGVLAIVCAQLFSFATDFTNTNANANSSYNRSSAIWYAGTYLFKYNPQYGEAGYTDSTGKWRDEDCTNFASQILFCGAIPELVNGTRNTSAAADSMKSWYFTKLSYPYRSTSWTGADQFRQHWGNVNNTGYNRAYGMKTYAVSALKTSIADLYNYVHEGDILQYSDSAGKTGHTQIVYTRYSNGSIYMAQHSAYTFWWLSNYIQQTPYTYVSAIRIKQGS
jgi:hypothetical protein